MRVRHKILHVIITPASLGMDQRHAKYCLEPSQSTWRQLMLSQYDGSNLSLYLHSPSRPAADDHQVLYVVLIFDFACVQGVWIRGHRKLCNLSRGRCQG